MRVIIGDGKVSRIIRKNDDVILAHKNIEIGSIDSVYAALSKLPANTVVINTAAKINLEWCEANPRDAYLVNTTGALNVMKVCALSSLKFVHLSSGCIFDGNSEESFETSQPSPSAVYTRTKTWADEFISNHGYENYLILRPRQLVSAKAHPTNMLTKFASMQKISAIDESNSITCIEDLSDMIDHLLEKNCTGIYNCANSGVISPYEIALMIKDSLNKNLEVEKIVYEDYLKTLSVKRVNTILNVDKLLSTGFNVRSASDALKWCIKNYG